jgi:hypothetical protein
MMRPNRGLNRAAEGGDYPTAARAEYVFACMATNGGHQEALRRCSCAIDVIASVLPYDKYEKAETVLRMREGRSFRMLSGVRRSPADAPRPGRLRGCWHERPCAGDLLVRRSAPGSHCIVRIPAEGERIPAQLPRAAGDILPHPAAGDAGTSGAARRPAATV